MWRTGHDATLRMAVGTLMILDHLPEREAVIARLDAAAQQAPRLRWRLDDPTGTRTRPGWVEVADSHPARHLRTMAVGSPGDRRQLLELVGLLEPAPFDPDRGPWDVTLIEGLEGGKAADMRAHHVLTDGQGGLSMLGLVVDESMPSPPPPVEVAADQPEEAATVPEAGKASGSASPARSTSTSTSRPRRHRRAGRGRGRLVREDDQPDRRPRAKRAVGPRHGELGVASGRGDRRTPVSDSPVGHDDEPLRGADHSRRTRGCTRPRRESQRPADHGCECRSRPVSREGRYALLRATPRVAHHTAPHHWFLRWQLGRSHRVEVPTSTEHPGPHFGIVAERIAKARREPVIHVADGVASVVGRLPTRVLTPTLHAQANSVDFVATAVPGFRTDRHVEGTLIEECFPFGPRLGCLANISALANGDRLDIGIAVDPHHDPDSDLLVECLAQAFRAYAPEPDVTPERRRPNRTST